MSVPYDETVLTDTVLTDNSLPGPRPGLAGRPVLQAVLGAGCISSSAIMVTLANVGPATTAFFRCALALPVLAVLAAVERRRRGGRPLANRLYAVLGGLFLAVDLVLWNHSIADVGAGIATVLGNLQVLFVAALAWLILRDRPDRRYLGRLRRVPADHAADRRIAGARRRAAGGCHGRRRGRLAAARADVRRLSAADAVVVVRLAAGAGDRQRDRRLAAHYLVAARAARRAVVAAAAPAAGRLHGASRRRARREAHAASDRRSASCLRGDRKSV